MKTLKPDHRLIYAILIALVMSCALLGGFAVALTYSSAGEVAAAIGSIIGGIVGAGGAVGAVYFLINRQRHEEASNVSDAVQREIIEFTEMAIQSLRICEHIKSGTLPTMRKNAHTIMGNLDPVVYRAVAPHPQLVVKFYTQLVEIQQSIQIIAVGPGDDVALVPEEEAETLAKSLVTACQLAQAIISEAPDPSLDEQVPTIALQHIETALKSAKGMFFVRPEPGTDQP